MSEGLIYRYGGFGQESEFGAAVAATRHVDILSATLDTPNDPNLYYEGGLTRARRYHRPGYYAPSGNIAFGAQPDILLSALYWALGAGTKMESYGSENTLLPSFTARVGKDLYEQIVSGCTVNTLEFVVNDSFAQLTLDVIGQKDAKGSLTAEHSLLLDPDPIIAFHEVQVTAGYTCSQIKSITLNINNSLDGEVGRGCGSRHPYRIPAQAREIDLTLDLWFKDDVELERFWGGSAPSANSPTEFEIKLMLPGVEITLPRCIVAEVNNQPSGRARMDQPVTIRALRGMAGGHRTEILVEAAES